MEGKKGKSIIKTTIVFLYSFTCTFLILLLITLVVASTFVTKSLREAFENYLLEHIEEIESPEDVENIEKGFSKKFPVFPWPSSSIIILVVLHSLTWFTGGFLLSKSINGKMWRIGLVMPIIVHPIFWCDPHINISSPLSIPFIGTLTLYIGAFYLGGSLRERYWKKN